MNAQSKHKMFKREFIKQHNECLQETHSYVETNVKCFPKVICRIIVEYAQDLIHYALIQNFDRYWKTDATKTIECLTCKGESDTLFWTRCIHCKRKNTVCELGHLEICVKHDDDNDGSMFYSHSLLYNAQPEEDMIVIVTSTIDRSRKYTPVDSQTKMSLMKWVDQMIQ